MGQMLGANYVRDGNRPALSRAVGDFLDVGVVSFACRYLVGANVPINEAVNLIFDVGQKIG